MRHSIILLLLAVAVSFTVRADAYGYLRFVQADGTETALAADGLKITFDTEGVASVTHADGTATFGLDALKSLVFSDDGENVTPGVEPVTYKKGDVNADGEVTSADLAIVANILAGLDEAANYEGRADVNGDNDVTSADIAAIVNILAGIDGEE